MKVRIVFQNSVSLKGKPVEKCIQQHETRPGLFIGWEQTKSSFTDTWRCITQRKTYEGEVNCSSFYINIKTGHGHISKKEWQTIDMDVKNV